MTGASGVIVNPSSNVSSRTIADSLVNVGREICGDLDAGFRREWLVTNGQGGYASGTLIGANSRRYHGLLVAALQPPVARTVLVAGVMEWVTYDGKRFPLSTHEYADGTIDPSGYLQLTSFRLEGTLPVWTYGFADVILERRIWMEHGCNTTFVSYTLIQASLNVELSVTPLVTYRDFHALRSAHDWNPEAEARSQSVIVRAFPGAQPFQIMADRGEYQPGTYPYWNFLRRAETERGLDDREDLFAVGTFTASLSPGSDVNLRLSTVEKDCFDAAAALASERYRQQAVLEQADVAGDESLAKQLTLAADQFIVDRYADGEPAGKTVIAGYHWFNDWGRDTMIALPGLTLATGRPADAANILRTFAGYVSEGMLPNNFPDQAGSVPGYNTVDATLWYVLAIRAYYKHTGDDELVDDLLPVLREIVDRHVNGTRFGIGADPADSLLRAGEAGQQLTWMDAKIGDWVVTPRIGKPVEINALWFNALMSVAELLSVRDPDTTRDLTELAGRVQDSFRRRFISPDIDYLADVVDGPDGDDWTFRPNQIFAVSLPYPLMDGDDARRVVDVVGRKLLTNFGLRSLAPDDSQYRPHYGGDQLQRDGGYHQGPVWSWLAGPYVEAHFRVYGDRSAALRLLETFGHQLVDGGLGTISEILDGDPPHRPRGCIAQAWSVAEILRVLRMLTKRA